MSNWKLQCPIQGHNQSEIQWICLCQSCQIENKAICQECLDVHHWHYPELIKMNNFNNGIKQLRIQIQDIIKTITKKKEKLQDKIFEINQMIETNYQEQTKPLQDLDNMIKKNVEELYPLITQIRENSAFEGQNDQAAKPFLFISQNLYENTFTKCFDYCQYVEKLIDILKHQVNQQQNTQQLSYTPQEIGNIKICQKTTPLFPQGQSWPAQVQGSQIITPLFPQGQSWPAQVQGSQITTPLFPQGQSWPAQVQVKTGQKIISIIKKKD